MRTKKVANPPRTQAGAARASTSRASGKRWANAVVAIAPAAKATAATDQRRTNDSRQRTRAIPATEPEPPSVAKTRGEREEPDIGDLKRGQAPQRCASREGPAPAIRCPHRSQATERE